MKPTAQLRQFLRDGKTLHIVGAHDALSALLIERAGLDGVYVGSYSTQAAFLGKPDLDLMSKTERLIVARHIVKATRLPVIVDIEEGYGNAISVFECVRDFEAIGAAGVHLDDEKQPSKCPVMQGIPPTELISTEEMCGKIQAAISARQDPDLLIIAQRCCRNCGASGVLFEGSEGRGSPAEQRIRRGRSGRHYDYGFQ